ncbi:YtzI protein [Pontibacillus yanchengensis]|uniref:YtzI protein n=1 Tax=Pontibacillus yanchengensis TaxID=462910 RepID=UPI000B1F5A0B|nr:YtzI protein [Pontibacillus yanchengensis]
MFAILIVCMIIMVAVLLLTMAAISKGYQYNHTVDPLPDEIPADHNENHSNKKA